MLNRRQPTVEDVKLGPSNGLLCDCEIFANFYLKLWARSTYKTGVTVYLVLGLVAVMTIVSLVTSTPELDLTKWFRGQDSEVRNIVLVMVIHK